MDVIAKEIPFLLILFGITMEAAFFDFTPMTVTSPVFPFSFVTLNFRFPTTKLSPFLACSVCFLQEHLFRLASVQETVSIPYLAWLAAPVSPSAFRSVPV